MDYDRLLQRVLEHIDAHLQDDLSAEALAAVAGFSTYHFCRVFSWRVGYSVMDYVRGRRLAYAAAELSGGKKIIDIAMMYGFETHSGFSKAFRRRFGCPPEVYRRHAHQDLPAPPSLALMEKYRIGGIVMEPKFVTKPAVKLAGHRIRTTDTAGENNKAIPAFWQAYLHDGRMDRLHKETFLKNHAEYGACFPPDPATGEFDYVIGVEVKDGATVPEGYHVCTIPAATYAVFSTPPSDEAHLVQSIQGTWSYIFNEWFPNSGYEYAPGCADYELYDERKMAAANKAIDICIPVVKKEA